MIDTAVIFCGGYGTRLGSLTKKIPKPMVLVDNKPFLEHLINQLKENGIKKLYLLVGYKKEKIIEYFGNGKKFSIKIIYSYNHPNYQTAYRLNCIKKKIKKDFLLMYSDNYCPFNIKKNFEIFKKKKSLVTFSICEKKSGNISIDSNQNTIYRLKRSKTNNFVEIGYMIVKKEFLSFLDNRNINLNILLNKLSRDGKISGIKTHNKYLSISDKQRLSLTRKFFRNKKFILIDRDGVINLIKNNDRYVKNLQGLHFNKKIISQLEKFKDFTYLCITNQAGIATGEVLKKDLKKINQEIKIFLKKKKINLKEFFISEHHYNSNNFYRKPNPGNFLKASEKYSFLLDKTFYIGDDVRDVEAAYNANTKCLFVGELNKKNKTILKKFNNLINIPIYKALKKKHELQN
tara:strand:+ start:2938 stop:4146 length:1209 start_codon:yes stop_codon:yes gene_type:complete